MVTEKEIEEFLKRAYKIDKLYPHQKESLPYIVNGVNLLVTVPTASGKTLIAVGAIYKALKEGKKAVYISPLVALSGEKFLEFTEIFHDKAKDYDLPKKYRVSLSTGATYKYTGFENTTLKQSDIIVTTNEKFDSIIRRKPKWIKDIGVIVLDEIHLMYDPNRGSTLELVQTYLKYLKKNGVFNPSIIALSATVGNPDDIADWMEAEVIESNFRPVELVKLVYDEPHKKLIKYEDFNTKQEVTSESYARLPIDFILKRFSEGKQVVTFVSTRRSAEALAENMSRYTQGVLTNEDRRIIKEAVSEWGKVPVEERLKKLVLKGAAFHHAGLSFDMRATIEKLFREGHIKFISATPSISQGVNLPANTVIIRDIKRYNGYYQVYLQSYEIEQMIGRAGRPQYDDVGYGIIIAKNQADLSYIEDNYVNPEIDPVYSPLLLSLMDSEYTNVVDTRLAASVLGIINVLEKPTMKQVLDFFKETYMNYTIEYSIVPEYIKWTSVYKLVGIDPGHQNINNESRLSKLIKMLVDYFKETGMVEEKDNKLHLTKYGKKVMQLYISPATAEIIRENLGNLQSELSVIALAMQLPEMGSRGLSSRVRIITPESWEKTDYLSFYTAHQNEITIGKYRTGTMSIGEIKLLAAMKEWIDGVDSDIIMLHHNVMPGELYRVSNTLRWLIFAISEIYRIIKKEKSQMLENLVRRMEYGVTDEALELIELKGIGRVRARKLISAGIKTIDELAALTPETLKKILGVEGDTLINNILSEARLRAGYLDNESITPTSKHEAKNNTLDAYVKSKNKRKSKGK